MVDVPSVVPLEPTAGDRRSYAANLEGATPAIVMEFLSATEGGEYSIKPTFPPGKWFFYEQILKIPFYVLFDPLPGLLELYQLNQGWYELRSPDANNRYWIEPLKLFLGIWQGKKEERTGYWLRWWNQAGDMLPWAVEQLEQERQRAEQERQRAEQEHQRAEKLAEYLRSQGIDPDAV